MIKIATVVEANSFNHDVLSVRMNDQQLEKENCEKQDDNTLQTNKWYTSPFSNCNFSSSNTFQMHNVSPLHKSNSRVATGLDLKSRYSRKQDTPVGGQLKEIQQTKKERPVEEVAGFNDLYNNKARFVREIQMQISLLESKSKQPGIRTNDLQPLGQEIYQKLDQYYINYGIAKNFVFYHKPAADQHYKKSQVHEPTSDRNPESKKLHRPRSLLSGLSNGKQRSGFSRMIGSEQDGEGVANKKIFKNASLHQSVVSSLSERSITDEEMRIVETKMSQSELAELDKMYEPMRKMSEEDAMMNNHSFIELKENIRVMEERIAFLIHRLEENKKEISLLKDENNILEGREKEEIGRVKELRKSLEHLNLVHKGCVKQNDSLQRALESMKKQKNAQLELNRAYERQINELHEQIQFLKSELADKLSKISTLQVSLKLKGQEYSELNMAYHGLEEEEELRRSALMKRLEESDNEKTLLKDTIKEYKNRLESEGLSFKFQEAHKLKQLFQESQTLHIRQIQKLDESYSKVICSLRDELRAVKNSKILLENALIQWFGIEKVKEMNLKVIEKGKSFESQTLSLAAIQYDFGTITGQKMGGQFLRLIESVKALKEEKLMKNELIDKCEDRIQILKEECQERFEQFQVLSVRVKDQDKVIERLNKEKEELLLCFNEHIHETKCKHQSSSRDECRLNSMQNSKIQSKIFEISLSRNSVSENQEITLQCFLKKKAISSPKDIIKFGIKLIEFSEELHQTYNKKLPSLTPHSILISIKNLKDIDISFSKIAKKEQQEGLIYQAPQIILGFSESTLSHCWTIGIIIDELLHKKRFFKSFGEVLSHKDTYVIGDDRFKNMNVLLQMIKKSHKQRITLQKAKEELNMYLKRMGNHHENKSNKI